VLAGEPLELGAKLGLLVGLEDERRPPQRRSWLARHYTTEKKIPTRYLARDGLAHGKG